MSGWTEGSSGLGKTAKKPKKVVHEVRTRKGKTGGFIHEHHHTSPEHHPMEEHVSPDQDAMAEHMMQTLGSPNPGEGSAAPPSDDSSGGAPDPSAAAAGATPPPGAGAPPPTPGGM